MTKLQKAQIIAKQEYACFNLPEPNDGKVKYWMKKPPKEFKERYELAKMQLSAMTWNTLTLGKGYE